MGNSYNIELVPAILTPFDWQGLSGSPPPGAALPIQNNQYSGYQPSVPPQTITSSIQEDIDYTIAVSGFTPNQFTGQGFLPTTITGISGIYQGAPSIYPTTHPLYPLTQTGGVVFPYNPTITESISIKYDTTELTQTNESIHAYKGTDNVRITLSDCVWTSETFDQAIYTLAVIHFFRSYSLMDFGRGANSPNSQPSSSPGRPPSPMWFSAYGNFMYYNIPVLIEKIDYTMPNDVDYVGVPNPGTDAYDNQQLSYFNGSVGNIDYSGINVGTDYTWIPIKFSIGSIGMIVQHSVAYWTTEFSLDSFKAGLMIGRL
jgi:hypothetical protein